MARSREIWLADAQGHNIIHGRGNIEITPDSRRAKLLDTF
jgi:hypothetical protein